MNIIEEKARELGALIQKDERYSNYFSAKQANDNDEELQQMINEFNMKRMQLNAEVDKETKNSERIAELDDSVKSLYGTIMANKNMIAYNKAKSDMEGMLNQINMIITYSANGEDPMTCPCEEPTVNCAGNCSSCSGCH